MKSHPKRVLLVEDNPDNAYLATVLLEERGYSVVAARNGAEALNLAPQGRYEFILLDLQLPDIDGFEVARRVLADPATARLPIIAVSAFAMEGDRRRAVAAGCTGYLEKPIDPDAFMDQVECLASIRA